MGHRQADHVQRTGHDESMKKLTVKQMMDLCEEASARKRQMLLATLRDADADSDMRIRELKAHDRYHGNLMDLFDYIQTPVGAARAIELAGRSLDGLDPQALIMSACDACGWDIEDINKKAAAAVDPTLSPSPSPATG